jgi:hypothetical protein
VDAIVDTARLNLNSFSYGSIAGTSERASSTDVDYGGRGVERSKNDEAFSALGCGSAGFIDRHGNGARPISEQSTEVAGNIWTEQRKPK